MNDQNAISSKNGEKVEVSIQLDSELLEQVNHLTNNPSKVIETALRQWLRGERPEDDLALRLQRKSSCSSSGGME
jgi:metal-responsive CopG/Arc/MetJ family transcriptional regulator